MNDDAIDRSIEREIVYNKDMDREKLRWFLRSCHCSIPRGGSFDAGKRVLARFTKHTHYPPLLDHLWGFKFDYDHSASLDSMILVSQPYGYSLEEHGNFCLRFNLIAFVFGKERSWYNPDAFLIVFLHNTIKGINLNHMKSLPWRQHIYPSFSVQEK